MAMPTEGLLLTLAGWTLAALVILVVWRRSYFVRAPEEMSHSLYGKRRPLAIAIAVFVVGMVAWSYPRMPFHAHATTPDHVVEVHAFMWGWEFVVDGHSAAQEGDTVILPAGDIEFRVTAPNDVHDNVNHGFGLYGPSHAIVVQVQGMPGRTNIVRALLTPGAYDVLCMEFCGVMHHQMTAAIIVKGESK